MLWCAMEPQKENAQCEGAKLPPGPPYIVQPGSEIERMQERAKVLVKSHFTLAGVVERIKDFVANPVTADLVCVTPPPSLVR